MPNISNVSGAYCGVTTFKTAANIQTTQFDELILEHLLAASREIDRLTQRRYFPVTATNSYRWPPFHVAASWEIWTEDDLLSVSSITASTSGINATPVAITHYFLEPQQHGPPYNRVEVDLSSSDVFTAGTTPQRSVAITGQWGYCANTVPVGTLAAPIGSTDTTISITLTGAVEAGDVLLIENEAVFAEIYPGYTLLSYQRGVNGTTAAAHAGSTAVNKYVAPYDIRRMVRADALGTFSQDQASWGRTIGAGELAVEWTGKMPQNMRQRIIARSPRVWG